MGTENSDSTIDLECSENPIMASTRIDDSGSMSLLRDNTMNEGFLIDSGSLSLSAIADADVSKVCFQAQVLQHQSEEGSEISQNLTTESDKGLDQEEDSPGINSVMEDETQDPSEMELEEEEGTGIEQDSEDVEAIVADTEGDLEGPEESNTVMELDNEDQDGGDDDDEDEENAVDFPLPQFPISRVKKIMSICMSTNEAEDEADNDAPAKKGKEKKQVKAGPLIITKEAAYLMALSTEFFIGKVGEMGGRITVSSKKKTMTLEHLKRALSDTEAFAFLEGCFQPSIIIGD